MISRGLNHIAISFAPGTLTPSFRDDVVSFYGDLLGWSEIDELRLDDRMTLATGGGTYLNLRERDDPMTCSGYEHLGVTVASADDAEAVYAALDGRGDVERSEIHRGDDGFRSFRFRYLLPLAVEIQYFPH